MKKFYAFAVAALAALSMNAQELYFVGSWMGDWDPANPVVATLENGNYTITIQNVNKFKMSTAKGSWDEFNASALQVAEGFVITKDSFGTPIKIENGDGDIDLPWQGDYTFIVNAALTTLTLSTTTPEPTTAPDVFIRGGMNSWGSPAEWQMENTKYVDANNMEYQFWCDPAKNTTITAGVEFKIADANWGNVNYGVTSQIEADPYEATELIYNANNIVLDSDFEGLITFTITGYHTAKALFDSEAGVKNVEIDNNLPVEYFNLQGVRVENPENGLFIARQGKTVTKVVK